MTTLQVEFSVADLGEIEVYVGDTYFWVGPRDVNSAYQYGDIEPRDINDACDRLGIYAEDLVSAAHDISSNPHTRNSTVESAHTAEHLAALFGCDVEDVSL